MEHEIIFKVVRYQESGYPGQIEPEEIEVYSTKRYVNDNDLLRVYDIFDEAKMEASVAIDADVTENCPHLSLVEDGDLEVCVVCGQSRDEIEADDVEHKVDIQIDNKRNDELS